MKYQVSEKWFGKWKISVLFVHCKSSCECRSNVV